MIIIITFWPLFLSLKNASSQLLLWGTLGSELLNELTFTNRRVTTKREKNPLPNHRKDLKTIEHKHTTEPATNSHEMTPFEWCVKSFSSLLRFADCSSLMRISFVQHRKMQQRRQMRKKITSKKNPNKWLFPSRFSQTYVIVFENDSIIKFDTTLLLLPCCNSVIFFF